MLKIYLCHTEYEIHSGDQIKYLCGNSHYVIRDESVAVAKTVEWGAYTEEAKDAYDFSCDLRMTRKGMKASYWTWDDYVTIKEWLAPDAKLVAHVSYEEKSCSAGYLLKLPVTDVIAYLKQEGLSFPTPS